MKYGVLEIRKCFEGTDVDVTVIVQKAQRSIVNFKSASTVLLEALSWGPILPISDVHWTPPFSGFYKLNVDAAGPLEEGKWDIGVVVRHNEGVVVAASCWQIFSLLDSEVAEALAMRKGLEFAKDMCFINLIAESDASNVISALNTHQQSSTYVGSTIKDCISFNICFRSLNFCMLGVKPIKLLVI